MTGYCIERLNSNTHTAVVNRVVVNAAMILEFIPAMYTRMRYRSRLENHAFDLPLICVSVRTRILNN